MSNNIVTVNVSQTIAPAPSKLQGTGAFLTQGGTNTAATTLSLITQLEDLTAILASPLALSAIAWTANVVTGTTSAPHGWPNGKSFKAVIAGVTPAGYNGTVTITVTGTTTFTYPLLSNPGAETVLGTATPLAVSELLAMGTTFFAQGAQTAVYVLELGVSDVAGGVTALSAYLTANPGTLYRLLTPRAWDADSGFLALIADFESTTSKLYFHVTCATGNYSNYTALMKDVMLWIEAPAIPATEFSAAADFWVALSYNPSSTNQVTPNFYAYVFGVTPYPTKGNAALIATYKAAGVNIIGTGAEGGISNTVVWWGKMMDGNDLTYWYSVDWVQINVDLDLSNEIINGSNNPLAPLYYNQNGVNRLQARAQATMDRGVSFGLVLPPVAVAAVSFANWVRINESDYAIGRYGGLSVTYTPARGFEQIIFDVNVTNFPLA